MSFKTTFARAAQAADKIVCNHYEIEDPRINETHVTLEYDDQCREFPTDQEIEVDEFGDAVVTDIEGNACNIEFRIVTERQIMESDL